MEITLVEKTKELVNRGNYYYLFSDTSIQGAKQYIEESIIDKWYTYKMYLLQNTRYKKETQIIGIPIVECPFNTTLIEVSSLMVNPNTPLLNIENLCIIKRIK